jgi:hypothetical protein
MPEVGAVQEQLPNAQQRRGHPLSPFSICKLLLNIHKIFIQCIFNNKFPGDFLERGYRRSAGLRDGWVAGTRDLRRWIGAVPHAHAPIPLRENTVSRKGGQAYAPCWETLRMVQQGKPKLAGIFS